MNWPEGVAGRKRVLTGALTLCLAKSKIADTVDPATVQSVLDMAQGELWREGEFRLEYVWKILCQQPGLSAREVAPPLAAFKSFEDLLPVQIRLPDGMAALPKTELARMRDDLTLTREAFEEFLKSATDKERALEGDAQKGQPARRPEPEKERAAAQMTPQASRGNQPNPNKEQRRRRLAFALSALALLSASGAVAMVMLDKPSPFAFDDVNKILALQNGLRGDESLTAQIADAKFYTLGRDEQRRLLERVFEVEAQKGVHAMSFLDTTGRTRAVASELAGQRSVVLMPTP